MLVKCCLATNEMWLNPQVSSGNEQVEWLWREPESERSSAAPKQSCC